MGMIAEREVEVQESAVEAATTAATRVEAAVETAVERAREGEELALEAATRAAAPDDNAGLAAAADSSYKVCAVPFMPPITGGTDDGWRQQLLAARLAHSNVASLCGERFWHIVNETLHHVHGGTDVTIASVVVPCH